MTLVFILLVTSALLGLATCLVFRVWALVPVSLLVAIPSAIALHDHGFGFARGVSVIIGCLVISQIAYVAGVFMMSRSDKAENLTQEQVDGDPIAVASKTVPDEDR